MCSTIVLFFIATLSTSLAVTLAPPFAGGLEYGACYYHAVSDSESSQIQSNSSQTRWSSFQGLREYCPDATVNNISPLCRQHWMLKTLDIPYTSNQGKANHHCPFWMFAAMLIDHTDASTTNFLLEDGSNCGNVIGKSRLQIEAAGVTDADSAASELIRQVGSQYGEMARTRSLWNKYSIYLTAEPSAATVAQLINLGIREIVYSVRTGDLIDLNYPVLAVRALSLMQRQTSDITPNLKVVIGQVIRDVALPAFSWQFNKDPNFHCPHMCQKYQTSSRGPRCRAEISS